MKNTKQFLTTLLTVVVSVSLVSAVAYAATIIGSNVSVDGTLNATSSSASALTIGRQGPTNPALQVDASTATSLTGLKIKAAGTGAGLALSVVETGGTNNALTIDAMGSGTITIGSVSTGAITLTRATTITGALTATGGITGITGNIAFTKEAARTISVADSTTADVVGAALNVTGAAGAATNGVGGAINITAGAGPGSGAGGAVNIKGGASSSGTNGAVNIGAANTSAVVITPATTITGAATLSSTLSVAGITTFGATAHVGKLLGAGIADDATFATAFDVGATAGKAMSFYLKSSSATASHVLQGLYIKTYHGLDAAAAAPSGDAARFNAYLTGDAAGTSALTGSHSTVEMAAGSTNTGLTLGSRGNLVLPNGTIGTSGTFAGAQAELFSGGSSTDVTGVTSVAILRLVVDGGAGFTLSKWTNVPAIRLDVPAAMVAATGAVMLDTTPTDVTPNAKLKINVNGTNYWILLAAGD